jgi:hypothetical protein
MTAFHHPLSHPRRWQRDAVRRLPALLHGGRIPLRLAGIPRRCPRVPFVAAEVLGDAIPQIAAAQDASLQSRGQQRHIRRFRAADDEGHLKLLSDTVKASDFEVLFQANIREETIEEPGIMRLSKWEEKHGYQFVINLGG